MWQSSDQKKKSQLMKIIKMYLFIQAGVELLEVEKMGDFSAEDRFFEET